MFRHTHVLTDDGMLREMSKEEDGEEKVDLEQELRSDWNGEQGLCGCVCMRCVHKRREHE